MPPFLAGDDPDRIARTIVADRRYQGTTAAVEPAPTLWERALHWLADRLADVFGAIGKLLGSKNPANVTIGIVTIAAVAVLLVFVGYRVALAIARSKRASAPRSSSSRISDAATSAELRDAARRAAQAGRFHDAAGLLFRSALRALDERGRIPYDAARTATEYRRMVRDPEFDVLAREAVIALFSDGGANAERYDRMDGAYARFLGRA